MKKIFDELGTKEKEYFSVPIGETNDELSYGHNDFFWDKDVELNLFEKLWEVLERLQ